MTDQRLYEYGGHIQESPVEISQLNESVGFISNIIKNLSNKSYRSPGFWRNFPNLRVSIEKILGVNLGDCETHHISAIHSNATMDSSNTSIENIAIIKKTNNKDEKNVHSELSQLYKLSARAFIQSKVKSAKSNIDEIMLYGLLDKDEEIVQLLIMLYQRMIKANIAPGDVFCFDISILSEILKELPEHLAKEFHSSEFRHNPNVILLSELFDEHPELEEPYLKDLNIKGDAPVGTKKKNESYISDQSSLNETAYGKDELWNYINNSEYAYKALAEVVKNGIEKGYSKEAIISGVRRQIASMKDDFGRIPTTQTERAELARDFVDDETSTYNYEEVQDENRPWKKIGKWTPKSLNEDSEGTDVYGSWSVEFDLTLEGEEVSFDDLSETTQEHIADCIGEGYHNGEIVEYDEEDEMLTGWWHVSFDLSLDDKGDNLRLDDLDDASIEHIVESIKDGYTSGELCEYREGEDIVERKLNETSTKQLDARRKDLFNRVRARMEKEGIPSTGGARLAMNDEEKLESSELSTISMIHSILAYAPLRGTETTEQIADYVMKNRYMSDYIKELGVDRAREVVVREVEDFKRATVKHAVFTDDEGIYYNAIEYPDDLEEAHTKRGTGMNEATYPRNFKLGENAIQYVKVYNQYGYTIQEIRIDNEKKTFERGNFSIGHDKAFKNRQVYEEFIDGLKAQGYTEIPSDYRCLKNKTRKGVPMGESVADTSMDANVKDWYCTKHPSDSLKDDINPDISFNDVVTTLKKGDEIYDLLEVNDSIVRERVFFEISQRMGVDYDVIYDMWLGGGDTALSEGSNSEIYVASPTSGDAVKTFTSKEDVYDFLETNVGYQVKVVDAKEFKSLVKKAKEAGLKNPNRFALNRLHQEKKTRLFEYLDVDAPYTYDEAYAELKELTLNFTKDMDSVICYMEEEKDLVRDILKDKYEVVDVSDGRRTYGERMNWIIAYAMPKAITRSMKEAYTDYDGWSQEDIDLHKSIDWRARNYEEYPVMDDTVDGIATAYTDEGTKRAPVTFVKHIRPNPIYPPYYKSIDEPFDGVVGPMYDGNSHGKYDIHDRYESQGVYDMLSESTDDSEWKQVAKAYCKKIGAELLFVNDYDFGYETKDGELVHMYADELEAALTKNEGISPDVGASIDYKNTYDFVDQTALARIISRELQHLSADDVVEILQTDGISSPRLGSFKDRFEYVGFGRYKRIK